MQLLVKVSDYSATNKMTPANLAIVFGPNWLYSKASSSGGMENAFAAIENSAIVNELTKSMIQYWNSICN